MTSSIDNQNSKDSFAGKEQVSEVNSTTSAGEEITDEQRTLWQNVKKYRKVVWVTLGLTSAILLYGFDLAVVGSVSAMPVFQSVSLSPNSPPSSLTFGVEKISVSSTKANGSCPPPGSHSGTSHPRSVPWPVRW
jgi:hypothetical protein